MPEHSNINNKQAPCKVLLTMQLLSLKESDRISVTISPTCQSSRPPANENQVAEGVRRRRRSLKSLYCFVCLFFSWKVSFDMPAKERRIEGLFTFYQTVQIGGALQDFCGATQSNREKGKQKRIEYLQRRKRVSHPSMSNWCSPVSFLTSWLLARSFQNSLRGHPCQKGSGKQLF